MIIYQLLLAIGQKPLLQLLSTPWPCLQSKPTQPKKAYKQRSRMLTFENHYGNPETCGWLTDGLSQGGAFFSVQGPELRGHMVCIGEVDIAPFLIKFTIIQGWEKDIKDMDKEYTHRESSGNFQEEDEHCTEKQNKYW